MSRPIFHSLLCADECCSWDCPVARREGLPRDPDLAEYVPGQMTLADALEETS